MLPKFGGFLASSLAVLPSIVSSSPVVPHYFRATDVSRTATPTQVQNDLGKTLSKGTQILALLALFLFYQRYREMGSKLYARKYRSCD